MSTALAADFDHDQATNKSTWRPWKLRKRPSLSAALTPPRERLGKLLTKAKSATSLHSSFHTSSNAPPVPRLPPTITTACEVHHDGVLLDGSVIGESGTSGDYGLGQPHPVSRRQSSQALPPLFRSGTSGNPPSAVPQDAAQAERQVESQDVLQVVPPVAPPTTSGGKTPVQPVEDVPSAIAPSAFRSASRSAAIMPQTATSASVPTEHPTLAPQQWSPTLATDPNPRTLSPGMSEVSHGRIPEHESQASLRLSFKSSPAVPPTTPTMHQATTGVVPNPTNVLVQSVPSPGSSLLPAQLNPLSSTSSFVHHPAPSVRSQTSGSSSLQQHSFGSSKPSGLSPSTRRSRARSTSRAAM